MVDALRIFAARFEDTPIVASREMRSLFELDRKAFADAAIEVMRGGAAGPGEQYALTLLVSNNLIVDRLLDPSGLALRESCEIASRIQATMDSFFDVKLLRLLTSHDGKPPAIGDPVVALRVLEIVGAISDGCRVMTLLSQMVAHSDSRIRSKVALLIGRINHNLQWATTRLADSDARVRANAIESLWGLDTPESRRVFRSACEDPDNRVAGNSALGLYQCGDLEAAEILTTMLKHAEPRFRASAAWAMGETADPRFLQPLTGQLNETDALARRRVFSAISKVRGRMKQAKEGGALSVVVTHISVSDSDRRVELSVSLGGQRVSGLAPVNIVLADTGTLVHRFRLQPRKDEGVSAAAFLFPRFTCSEDPHRRGLLHGLRNFVAYKRKLDSWAAVRYSAVRTSFDTQPVAHFEKALLSSGSGGGRTMAAVAEMPREWPPGMDVEPVQFSSDPRSVLKACDCSTSRSNLQTAQHAAKRIIDALSLQRGNKLLYVFGRDLDSDGWSELATRVRDSHVRIHAVALDGEVSRDLRRLCLESGGSAQSAASPGELAAALSRMAAAQAAGYTIRYALPTPALGPVRIQVYAAEGFGEDTVLL